LAQQDTAKKIRFRKCLILDKAAFTAFYEQSTVSSRLAKELKQQCLAKQIPHSLHHKVYPHLFLRIGNSKIAI
jgi:hypothetical protein